MSPLLAQASVLSFFTLVFEKSASSANAQGSGWNSQSLPLLQPAVNIDPNPAQGGGDITVVDSVALLAADSPAGTLADTGEGIQSSQISVHVVRDSNPPETLSTIAEMYGVSVNTLRWANDIQKGDIIHPGQELVILPITGVRHVVGKGETLASIAKQYKGDISEIASYNDLSADAALAAGDVIIIPDGVVPTASSGSYAASDKTAPIRAAGGPEYKGYYAWPVNGGVVTQGIHGFNGVDIGANEGTSILAAAAGVVIVARDNGAWNGGYGNYIVIKHDNGTQTLYGHAKTGSLKVSVGDAVAKGQAIAGVGHTGKATGNHLHFEVRGAVNPFGR